jgi:sugar lactone lactonase YvrE
VRSGDRQLQLLREGLGFGEGLRWRDGRLWFSDFLLHHVVSLGPDNQLRVEAVLDDQPSGLGWLPDGRLLIVSMHQKAVLRRERDGSLTRHADLSAVARGHTNDMVVSAKGIAYVGNFGGIGTGGGPEADLALVRPDGTVEVAARDLRFPNGCVITPDARLLIVGESLGYRYRAFPIDVDGRLGEGRIWAELGRRVPDGCTLDAEGAIWFGNAANAGGRELVRVREGGDIVEVIETPEPAYACCLGGGDGRTLYFVTAPGPPSGDMVPGDGKLYSVEVDVQHAGLP